MTAAEQQARELGRLSGLIEGMQGQLSRIEGKIEGYAKQADVVELFGHVSKLEQGEAGQSAVGHYRRWLVGLSIAVAGLLASVVFELVRTLHG